MRGSWIVIWVLILVHSARYDYIFRALLASQEAAPPDGRQGKTAGLHKRSLGGKKSDSERHHYPAVAPLQVYVAEPRNGKTGAASRTTVVAPAWWNNVCGLVHGLRGQSLSKGLLLPTVWREASYVHATAASSSLDIHRLEQGRIAQEKTLSQAPNAGRSWAQTARYAYQLRQRCTGQVQRWSEGEGQVRGREGQAGHSLQDGASSRCVGVANKLGQAAEYSTGPAGQCREERAGQPGAGAGCETRGFASFDPGSWRRTAKTPPWGGPSYCTVQCRRNRGRRPNLARSDQQDFSI